MRSRRRSPAVRRAAAFALVAAAVTAADGLGGCAGGPPVVRTTLLRSVDLVSMTDRMATALAAAPAVVDRGPDAPRWIVSMERIENRTNQIIPDGEKWLYVARLRGLLAQTDLARRANLAWIMPPERWADVVGELDDPREPLELRTPPTHRLSGTFIALTTTSGAGRTDTTVCSYQLLDLATGILVWEDSWEVTRTVEGLSYD